MAKDKPDPIFRELLDERAPDNPPLDEDELSDEYDEQGRIDKDSKDVVLVDWTQRTWGRF